jgi:integrase
VHKGAYLGTKLLPICFPISAHRAECFPGDDNMQFTKAMIDVLAVPEGKGETIVWDPGMPGFGCRIRSGGSRTWVAQYRVGTQQRRESLGDVRKVKIEDARKIARQRFASVELGIDPRAGQKPTIMLRKAAETYLAIKKDTMRPASFIQAKYHFEKLWAPLANRRLDQINRADVAIRLQEIVKAHGRTSAARARGNLSAFFTWAAKEGLGVETNPVSFTNDPAEGIPARERVLDDDEIAALWGACGDDDFGSIVKLLVLTGCRREEIGGLRRSEVNFETGMLTLPPTRVKNKRTLILPLPPMGLDILRAAPPREGREHFFGGAKNGFVAWAWDKMKIDARITAQRGRALEHWTLHDLRRTMRSGLARLGIAPHVAELAINHAKGGIQAVYDRYTYLPQIGAALAAWSAHIEQAITGRKADRVLALQR